MRINVAGPYTDLTEFLGTNDRFRLSHAQVAALAPGGGLVDGPHTLYFRTVDFPQVAD